MVVDGAQTADVVDAADVGRGHGAKRPRRLEVVAVVQSRWCGASPVGEPRRPHARSHEV